MKPLFSIPNEEALDLFSLPSFIFSQYTATVDENKKDVVVVRMMVTDEDEPQTPAWNAKFKIVSGDPDGLFTVKTGTNKQEGILSTAKVGRKSGIHS